MTFTIKLRYCQEDLIWGEEPKLLRITCQISLCKIFETWEQTNSVSRWEEGRGWDQKPVAWNQKKNILVQKFLRCSKLICPHFLMVGEGDGRTNSQSCSESHFYMKIIKLNKVATKEKAGRMTPLNRYVFREISVQKDFDNVLFVFYQLDYNKLCLLPPNHTEIRSKIWCHNNAGTHCVFCCFGNIAYQYFSKLKANNGK